MQHTASQPRVSCRRRGHCGHGLIPWLGGRRPAHWSRDALRRALLWDHPPGKWRHSLPSLAPMSRLRQLDRLDQLQREESSLGFAGEERGQCASPVFWVPSLCGGDVLKHLEISLDVIVGGHFRQELGCLFSGVQ